MLGVSDIFPQAALTPGRRGRQLCWQPLYCLWLSCAALLLRGCLACPVLLVPISLWQPLGFVQLYSVQIPGAITRRTLPGRESGLSVWWVSSWPAHPGPREPTTRLKTKLFQSVWLFSFHFCSCFILVHVVSQLNCLGAGQIILYKRCALWLFSVL